MKDISSKHHDITRLEVLTTEVFETLTEPQKTAILLDYSTTCLVAHGINQIAKTEAGKDADKRRKLESITDRDVIVDEDEEGQFVRFNAEGFDPEVSTRGAKKAAKIADAIEKVVERFESKHGRSPTDEEMSGLRDMAHMLA